MFSVASGEFVTELWGHQGEVTAVAVNPVIHLQVSNLSHVTRCHSMFDKKGGVRAGWGTGVCLDCVSRVSSRVGWDGIGCRGSCLGAVRTLS